LIRATEISWQSRGMVAHAPLRLMAQLSALKALRDHEKAQHA
jgi:hypothetical protein